MPQLKSTHTGWIDENLASYILSRFSFISKPLSIGDDLGTDFICTIFRENGRLLFPAESFQIQIKSNMKAIKVKDPHYLEGLTHPYFVGVVNKEDHSLIIYSGECVPHFFSQFGPGAGDAHPVEIRLVDDRNDRFYNEIPQKRKAQQKMRIMYFYRLCEIEANQSNVVNCNQVDRIIDECRLIGLNISKRKNGSYVFHLHDKNMGAIYIGSGSQASHFKNFRDSVEESYFNIDQLIKKGTIASTDKTVIFFREITSKMRDLNIDELTAFVKSSEDRFSWLTHF